MAQYVRYYILGFLTFLIFDFFCVEVEHDSDEDQLIAVSDPRKGGKPAGSFSSP